MRILRNLILALLLVGLPAFSAVNIRLAWDIKPASETWTEVRCYERIGATAPYTYVLAGTVAGTVSTITLPNVTAGQHSYIVRAYNGQQESADSNVVTTTILSVPTAPGNVTITIVIQ
jgi:hypothetical protein